MLTKMSTKPPTTNTVSSQFATFESGEYRDYGPRAKERAYNAKVFLDIYTYI